MSLMPYAMDKGPYLSIMEDFVNGNRTRARLALETLRDTTVPVADLAVLSDSDSISGGPLSAEQMRWHVNADWFGRVEKKDATGTTMKNAAGKTLWDEQPAFSPQTNTYTGFWEHWYGDAEGVYRETMIRALEVGLGCEHGKPIPTGKGSRHWYGSIYWNCPHPWYEGWVMWKRFNNSARGGHITVIINTPAHRPRLDERASDSERIHTGELSNTPYKLGPNPERLRPYEKNPTKAEGAHGMWVVSHELNQEWTPNPGDAKTSPQNGWRPPTLGKPYRSVGNIVTVSIAEADGGVLPEGRPWAPAQP